MKKIKTIVTCVSIALLALPLAVNAATLDTKASSRLCPYTDYFTIKGTSDARIIGSPYTLGSLTFTQQSDTYFTLGCGDSNVYSGDLYVDVGLNDDNKCTLDIHDGPFTAATVNVEECKGIMSFRGLEPTDKHNFNLNFSV